MPNLSRKVRITARDYGAWWANYDASGLHPDERPPESLVQLARGAATVLSSTLPRAIETAREATEGRRDVPADPMFVEAALPPPPIPALKLTPGQWGVVSRLIWSFGYAPQGVESVGEAWERVDRIVERLVGCTGEGDVLLCAHGYLNWMIGRRLIRAGWRAAAREGGHRYWSWRVFEPPAPTAERAALSPQAE